MGWVGAGLLSMFHGFCGASCKNNKDEQEKSTDGTLSATFTKILPGGKITGGSNAHYKNCIPLGWHLKPSLKFWLDKVRLAWAYVG